MNVVVKALCLMAVASVMADGPARGGWSIVQVLFAFWMALVAVGAFDRWAARS